MGGEKYGKERRIRGKYRRVCVRRTVVQRGYYESRRQERERERREGSWSLGRGKSRWLVLLNERTRRGRVWRRRVPGRFLHEWRKRQGKTRRRRGRGRRRGRKWYESKMDLGRKDRRRSRSNVVPRRRRGYRKERRVENRKRRRRGRRRVSRRRGSREKEERKERERKEIGRSSRGKGKTPVVTEFSIRKRLEWMNRGRWRRSSRRWTERRRRGWYRNQGRKGGKRKG